MVESETLVSVLVPAATQQVSNAVSDKINILMEERGQLVANVSAPKAPRDNFRTAKTLNQLSKKTPKSQNRSPYL
jgi:hypothetical protein